MGRFLQIACYTGIFLAPTIWFFMQGRRDKVGDAWDGTAKALSTRSLRSLADDSPPSTCLALPIEIYVPVAISVRTSEGGSRLTLRAARILKTCLTATTAHAWSGLTSRGLA